MKMIKRIMSLFLLALIIVPLITTNVFAESIEERKDVSLTVSFKNGDAPVKDAVFHIYHIANCDEFGKLSVTEEFQGFNVDVYGKADSFWIKMASTLENYVISYNTAPTDSGKTNENGILTFPTEKKELPKGLYLVLADRHVEKNIVYDVTPFLILLPTADSKNNSWIYDLEVSPKFTAEEIPEIVTRKVLKIWDDGGNKTSRPEEISVRLMKDGKLFEKVTLSAENDWSYKWEGLDGKSKWTLTEDPVEGYTATVSREGITFVVTNTLSESDSTASETDNDNESGTNLPQTGLLWWPVILLLSVGLLFIIVGILRRRGSQN